MLTRAVIKSETYRKDVERLEKEVEELKEQCREKDRRIENLNAMYNRMKDISRNIKSVSMQLHLAVKKHKDGRYMAAVALERRLDDVWRLATYMKAEDA